MGLRRMVDLDAAQRRLMLGDPDRAARLEVKGRRALHARPTPDVRIGLRDVQHAAPGDLQIARPPVPQAERLGLLDDLHRAPGEEPGPESVRAGARAAHDRIPLQEDRPAGLHDTVAPLLEQRDPSKGDRVARVGDRHLSAIGDAGDVIGTGIAPAPRRRAARRPVRPLVEIAGSGVPPEAVRQALPQNGKRREEQRPPKGRRLPPNVSKASTHHERHSFQVISIPFAHCVRKGMNV